MGIDSWVLRSRGRAQPAAQSQLVGDPGDPAIAAQAVYQLDERALDRWLAQRQFHTLAAAGDATLLIVTEGDGGGAEAEALLASMLKAIALDIVAQWRVRSGDTGEALQQPAQARAILLLARLAQPSDIASLAHLRQRLLQHAGVALAVTIHPTDLLANNAAKRPAWEDLKRLKGYLDEQSR